MRKATECLTNTQLEQGKVEVVKVLQKNCIYIEVKKIEQGFKR